MREIKFRGKRVDDGEWVHGYLYGKNAIIEEYSHYTVTSMGTIITGIYEVDPKTIGQFTGYADTNNDEICEGDIVKFEVIDPKDRIGGYLIYSGNAVVEWDDDRFFVTWSTGRSKAPLGHGEFRTSINIQYSLKELTMQVIGNIYENPELLEAQP